MTAPDDDMRWQVTAATTRCCMHVQLSRHLHQKYGDRLSLASTSHRWIKDRPVDPMMLGHANCNIGRKGHVLNMRIARHHTMSMHVRCDDVNYVELCSRGDEQWPTNKRWYRTSILKYYFLTDVLWLDIYLWSIFIYFSLIRNMENLGVLDGVAIRHEGLYAEYPYYFRITHPDLSLPWSCYVRNTKGLLGWRIVLFM